MSTQRGNYSEFLIIIINKWNVSNITVFALKLSNESRIHRTFLEGMCWLLGKFQGLIACKFTEDAQEGLVDVEVGAGADVEVSQVLLAVEGNGFRLHLSLLGVHLVTNEYNGDLATNTVHIPEPSRYVAVSDSVSQVKKQNAGLAFDVRT